MMKTKEELEAMRGRVTQQIDVVRMNLLRLEGYRLAITDLIEAVDAPATPTTDQKPTTENTDAQAAA